MRFSSQVRVQLVLLASACKSSSAFSPAPFRASGYRVPVYPRSSSLLRNVDEAGSEAGATPAVSEEEVAKVGNLVADDEWMGLSMELSEIVRMAIIEDVKAKTSDFIGKDEYKVGDISKEIDSRVKDEIANLRGKGEYELGDLTVALDDIAKDVTCEFTGKDDYEVGDLTREIDSRVKGTVASFCGKENYQAGDLTNEMSRRVEARVLDFVNKESYNFGDISREVENRRQQWVKDYLGEEAASNYQFGDLTKKAVTSFTGKDEYQVGDVTKKVLGNIFGKRKRGGSS